ncbi:MAG: LptA/OstA family protein [Synechococcales cyanobacterium]
MSPSPSASPSYRFLFTILALPLLVVIWLFMDHRPFAIAQNFDSKVPDTGRAITLQADIQEANSKTGVITARGNVQILYPARQIQATAAQAQYFSREGKIILSGNVYVIQQGNSIRGEVITYLVGEGRFVATPQPSRQVESIYIVSDPDATPAAPQPPVFNPKPTPKTPSVSPIVPR